MSQLTLPIRIDGRWQMIRCRPDQIPIFAESGAAVEFALAEVEAVLARLVEEMGSRKLEWSMAAAAFFSSISGPKTVLYFDLGGHRQEIDLKWVRLVLDTNAGLPAAINRFRTGNTREILEAFPACEVVVLSDYGQIDEWRSRWVRSGGRFFESDRMIALKTDPIWNSIGRLGHRHEPFDFDCWMGTEDVGRNEAESFGLLQRDTKLQPVPCEGCG